MASRDSAIDFHFSNSAFDPRALADYSLSVRCERELSQPLRGHAHPHDFDGSQHSEPQKANVCQQDVVLFTFLQTAAVFSSEHRITKLNWNVYTHVADRDYHSVT